MLHQQGDHVFNDWRTVFDGLDQAVLRATQKPQIAQRIAAVFAPLRTAQKVDEARRFTVKCVGHPMNFDQNSLVFGSLIQ